MGAKTFVRGDGTAAGFPDGSESRELRAVAAGYGFEDIPEAFGPVLPLHSVQCGGHALLALDGREDDFFVPRRMLHEDKQGFPAPFATDGKILSQCPGVLRPSVFCGRFSMLSPLGLFNASLGEADA